jgi:uncharacterized protein (DUF2147 family)
MNFSEPVRLSAAGLAYLQAKINKLNSRVEGAPPVTITAEPVTYTWAVLTDPISGEPFKSPSLLSPEQLAESAVVRIERVEPWFDVTVSLNAPAIGDHILVARLEHLSEGNVVYPAPGLAAPVPTCYRTAKPLCGHCLTTRRRNDTFVLARPDDTTIQVGRNCLADYLRDPEAAERLLQWTALCQSVTGAVQESISLYANGGGGRWYWSFPQVVALAVEYGKRFGWLSASQAREQERQSSASALLSALCTTLNRPVWLAEVQGEADAALADPTSEANRTVAWIAEVLANKPENETTDYESNLVVLCKAGAVHSGQFALAASAFRAHWAWRTKAEREAAEAARKAQAATGNHVGTVGEREVFADVNCVSVKSLGVGEYGERFLVKFLTPAGDTLVWFTGEGGFDAEEGRTYTIKATVKEHSEYNGLRQTIITRAAEFVPPPPKVKKPRAKKGETA